MDISFEPYKKVTIRSFMQHANPEAFVTQILIGVQKGTPLFLYWGNGILLRYYNFAQTDTVSREYLNGHLPIDFLEFSPMPTYKKEIRVSDFVVTVLDLSRHQTIGPLTKWLASNYVKKRS